MKNKSSSNVQIREALGIVVIWTEKSCPCSFYCGDIKICLFWFQVVLVLHQEWFQVEVMT